jgi:hypothetical protein
MPLLRDRGHGGDDLAEEADAVRPLLVGLPEPRAHDRLPGPRPIGPLQRRRRLPWRKIPEERPYRCTAVHCPAAPLCTVPAWSLLALAPVAWTRGILERVEGAVLIDMDAILASGPAAGTPLAIEDLVAAGVGVPDAPRPRTSASGPRPGPWHGSLRKPRAPGPGPDRCSGSGPQVLGRATVLAWARLGRIQTRVAVDRRDLPPPA